MIPYNRIACFYSYYGPTAHIMDILFILSTYYSYYKYTSQTIYVALATYLACDIFSW